MKHLLKTMSLLALTILVKQQAYSYDFEVNGIYYGYNSETKTAYVTNGSIPYSGIITIPTVVSYNGRVMDVTEIGSYAFRNSKDLVSLTLHNGIISIGDGAFYGCTSLKDISIPSTVTKINTSTFSSCTSLQAIHIPKSVKEIGNSAFEGCKSLKTFVIEDGEDYLSLGVSIFGNKLDNGSWINDWYYDHELIIPKYVYLGRKCGWESADLVRIDYLDLGINDVEVLSISNNIIHVPLRERETANGESKLKTIYSLSEIPPYLNVPSSAYVNARVYVPTGTKEVYSSHDSWNNFFQINEMDINKMWKGQGEPTTDDNLQNNKCKKPTIRYSNGKLLFESATEGAICHSTITDSDITSYNSNEVQLGVTYNISAYATAKGYDDSDVATATLCWVDVEPKTEGIENGIAQVRASAILIQSNNGELNISGTDNGTNINIYTTSGVMVGSAITSSSSTTIATGLRNGEIAIVRIGDKSVKVVMK